jgi:hypothetical protein
VLKNIEVEQGEIVVGKTKFFVTQIPTATSGCWYTVHDLFQLWAAVAIDLDGTVVGWVNEPVDKLSIEAAIRKEFDIPKPIKKER